ncbi:MAG: DUF5131 family protein [Patescibacteria group bacterium]
MLKVSSDNIASGVATVTWNPVTGCNYGCTYCFIPRYLKPILGPKGFKASFKPRLNEVEFTKEFKEGDFVFVTDLGDMFNDLVPREWILRVLAFIKRFPKTTFSLHSRNPSRFHEFDFSDFPNIYLGTTIETNRNYPVCSAPEPYFRMLALEAIPHNKKHLSLSPILDFDLDELVSWVERIGPETVEIGVDAYNDNLPEPSWDKVEALLYRLRQICPRVIEKNDLTVLKEAVRPEYVPSCQRQLLSDFYIPADILPLV